MTQRFAYFDVDCRELDAAGTGLSFRSRVAPLAERLHRLYALAGQRGEPLVFSTCCSGRMLAPDRLPGIVFVPLDPARREWLRDVPAHRVFYVEKRAYATAGANYTCRAFDIFATNGNVARLAAALDVTEWVVFGNGFDLCVAGVVRGLRAAGHRVCLLADVTCPSARGYGEDGQTGTEANRARLLAEMEGLGVRIATADAFLAGCAS